MIPQNKTLEEALSLVRYILLERTTFKVSSFPWIRVEGTKIIKGSSRNSNNSYTSVGK